jgi:hypothetical protein
MAHLRIEQETKTLPMSRRRGLLKQKETQCEGSKRCIGRRVVEQPCLSRGDGRPPSPTSLRKLWRANEGETTTTGISGHRLSTMKNYIQISSIIHLSFVDNWRSHISIFWLFISQRNKQTSLFLLAKSRQKEKLKFNNLKKKIWFWMLSIAKSEKNRKNRQILIFGFQYGAKNYQKMIK